ncbi:YcnI family protein [Kitasatospora sp. DSM 101779]|uniref:YcnI family protein n=1 Tax=Kitasatospora sp. DSM 101779 TaxID=2853165 RepID=UPI0021DAB3DF|nr:YcnI family protein [Kitasatospora sp. DSM 101779]MCU7825779.1 YcnI family protein [Kitasatospora sp. DSM 101779]
MNRSRLLARAAVPLAAAAGVLALAGPALAHVEVESATAQALATDAVVAFDAEGESSSAGIKQVKVVLPTGIAPSDVSLVEAPKGWTFTPSEDGYQVAGNALAPGKNAAYKIKVRQLPNEKSVVFKTLVTYSDGHVDRWIELPQGGAEPANPAPVLKLAAASPGAKPLPASSSATPSAAPTTASAVPSAAPSAAPSSASPEATAPAASDGGSGSGTATVVVVAVLAAAIVGVVLWRRRAAPRD